MKRQFLIKHQMYFLPRKTCFKQRQGEDGEEKDGEKDGEKIKKNIEGERERVKMTLKVIN